MKRVCVVTGTRAEYGLLRRLMRLLADDPRFELVTVVAGMHLSPAYGQTVREIERDGFEVNSRVDMLLSSDKVSAMAKGVGVGIYGFAQSFEILDPECVVVLGDRVEAFAAASAAALSNIAVAHIHGGDKSQGGLDEAMRHAITKLAHVHFVASEQSAERVLRLGEEPWRVHVVGAPGLDELLNADLATAEELGAEFGLDFDAPVLTVVQHPVSTESECAADQIRETMEAIRLTGLPAVVICPNADAGSHAMLDVLASFGDRTNLRRVTSLERRVYLGLLRHSAALVGNSSSGIIEAPFLGTPVVNIGTRQAGREQAGEVLSAGYDRQEIVNCIRRAVEDPVTRAALTRVREVYGDGHASERIVRALRDLPGGQHLLQKVITY